MITNRKSYVSTNVSYQYNKKGREQCGGTGTHSEEN